MPRALVTLWTAGSQERSREVVADAHRCARAGRCDPAVGDLNGGPPSIEHLERVEVDVDRVSVLGEVDEAPDLRSMERREERGGVLEARGDRAPVRDALLTVAVWFDERDGRLAGGGVGRKLAHNSCELRHERVGVALRVHEQPPTGDLLIERLIDGHYRSRHDVLVIHVGNNADDPARFGADADELDYRVRPEQGPVQGFSPGEQTRRDTLADDDDFLAVRAIVGREIATRLERQAERREVPG